MTTGNEKYSKMKEIFNSIEGVNLHDSKGGKNGSFHFKIATNQQMRETEIEVLELSVRSSNGLKRAGCLTIGQVIEAIETGAIKRVRNLGNISIREIMENLFLWYLSTMSAEQREKYILETIIINEHNKGVMTNSF